MHPYITDSDEHRKISLFLAVLGMLAAWGLHTVFQMLNFSPPWWSDIPSFAGFYELFFVLFDKWLWRMPLLRKVGVIKTPYLAGSWKGNTVSSFDHHKSQTKATIEIIQTWTRMLIILRTDNSTSHSQTASIITEIPGIAIVSYDYKNEPNVLATDTMHTHRGSARHEFRVEGKTEFFCGEYFTGRDRGTFGALNFKRHLES